MLRLFRSPAHLVSMAVIAALTVESALFMSAYFTAYQYIRQHDPRKSESVSGPLIFARPRALALGQSVTRDEIVHHLASIGYQSREGTTAGTFTIAGNKLQINSRLPEFPSTTITFERKRIAAITIEGNPAQRVEIEPVQLVSFVHLVRDDVARRMRVRRVALQPADLIPSALYDAVRSSEDFRFESHNGIDELGMIRSFFTGGGGSTLTEQLMKNAVLADQSRTYSRKLKTSMLALAAERQMSKQEIFAAYSNNCYMGTIPGGPALWGFGAAAKELFHTTDIRGLSIGRAAALAAILNKPEEYLKAARGGDYSKLRKRRERVLNLMRRNYPERYSEHAITQAKAEPLQFQFSSGREQEQPLDIVSRQFQDYAASHAQQLIGLTNVEANLHIFTTLEPYMQLAAYKAVTEQLTRLDPMIAALSLRQGIDPATVEPIQAAVVVMNAHTGEILAMVGNRNGEFNFANSKRSPGSAIKPFVYLKAIESGRHGGAPFTAATWLDPQEDTVDNYRPRQHVGAAGRARTLLARSDNGAAVVTAHDAGLRDVRDFIRTLTGSYSQQLTGMLAIGGSAGSEVSLINLVEGYSVFPNQGIKATQTPFTAVYSNGIRLTVPRTQAVRVTGEAPAYVVSEMLRSVMQSGGTAAGLPWGTLKNYSLALKTGTGQVADCWMVGFSPAGLVVGVWVGMPKNKPVPTMADGFDGARIAGRIWLSFLRRVSQHQPDLLEGEFKRPGNVVVLRIDPSRGCVTDGRGITEFFIQGREPHPC